MLLKLEPAPTRPRRGALAVELLLVLPILLILLMGMVEFSMLLTARQQLMAAARAAARIAAQGGSDQEAQHSVKQILGAGPIGTADVHVHRVADDPMHPDAGRERVEVLVTVPATRVAPNFLGWVGIDLGGHDLAAGVIMNRE